MPFLAAALLEKRRRLEALREKLGEKELARRHPEAKGYLRDPRGYRLFERRDELCAELLAQVKKNGRWLEKTLRYPLAASRS
jgi:hypothetical protein